MGKSDYGTEGRTETKNTRGFDAVAYAQQRVNDREDEMIAYFLQYALEGSAMNKLRAVLSDNSKVLLVNLLNYIGYDSGKD